ncbi:hypothetical protein IC006_2536 [Sulfuracidifex tepidarius]|uniref:Uncharacterized protein n=1 Tax=Sulfuracidifex tepidarius TaxID=1294262 RepID=A0A510DYA5_9CREN|nr:hypothetical protein IC006_2536 [Sulfuracidifex tepidarius]BBG27994.1 hypothetical protein IC007_2549 [Sulfuracidifex tepidarius]
MILPRFTTFIESLYLELTLGKWIDAFFVLVSYNNL